ncbi:MULTISPECIES: stalk domain-containing protein [unclassified Paenibacillus]|uniref:stalk domain-containing protein n=1 Tax=unclassified Paenibacillus TaxID=185978 RepID=UPI002787919E|nr:MULTISPECIES: stalk domain-containing protein [unclassified Paenibacillus]MDQ0897703.1 hypothetical protein [Paenibacillus sp. V4I7]MDQ0916305.1 hypothetical protein [Paenibacillus sp. V4I5]
MKRKKAVTMTCMFIIFLIAFACGAFADDYIKEIKAYQNSKITIQVDGSTVDLQDGAEQMVPIIYEGRSYVPVKPLAEALGAMVTWEQDEQAIKVSTANPSAGSASSPHESEGVRNTFPSEYGAPSMFEDFKPVAKEGITAYLNAIRSGEKKDLKAFIYKYYYSLTELDSPDVAYAQASEKVDTYRSKYDKETLNGLTAEGLELLKGGAFPDEASGYSKEHGILLNYRVVSGKGYYGHFSIDFYFYQEGNTYKLTNILYAGAYRGEGI